MKIGLGRRRRDDGEVGPGHRHRDGLLEGSGDVVRWAQVRKDRLVMVDDSHRLERHVGFGADEFGRFLQSLA